MSEDPRNEAVARNVEKLIKCLTGDSLTAGERRTQEQQAIHKIRHHRYLSTNGHAVRRSINNMIERFYYEAMDDHADAVRMLTTMIMEHAGWNGHYEVDIQYSVLDFMFSMTYEPVQNVRRNLIAMEQRVLAIRNAIEATTTQPDANESDTNWVALLSDHIIDRTSQSLDSDSSLSEWSDASDNDEYLIPDLDVEPMSSLQNKQIVKRSNTFDSSSSNPSLTTMGLCRKYNGKADTDSLSLSGFYSSRYSLSRQPELTALEPPQPQTQYRKAVFDPDSLSTVVHSHWWRQDFDFYAETPNSEPGSNFAIAYVQHMNRETRRIIKYPLPKTTSESNLVREIILMFFAPASCCFFEVQPDEKLISVRKNISISTVTSKTLKHVLEGEVLPALQAMQQLRRIINDLTLPTSDEPTTGTLKCFAWGLRDLINPVQDSLIDFERRLLDKADGKEDNDDSSTTLICFLRHMEKKFQRLLLLKSLATCAIIKGPPHLRSAYLLSQIYKHTMINVDHQKLATALLLVSMRRYCSIMDNWWQHAEFDDWHNEFIVECLPANDAYYGQRIHERLPRSDIDDNGDPHPHLDIIKELRSCTFYQLILEHALEAGETQDLLASVHLLGDLVLKCKNVGTLYTDLTKQLLEELKCEPNSVSVVRQDSQPLREYNALVLETTSRLGDPELMSIFTQHIRHAQEEQQQQEQQKLPTLSSHLLDILDSLKQSTIVQQPHVIPRSLIKLLWKRYEIANIHVMRWYREELKLTHHLRFLRHIMLLEADYLVYPFYTNLFRQIEGYEDWARCSLLTLELYDLLEPHYGHMANQLEVKLVSLVWSQSSKIFEALDAIEFEYSMPPPLQSIITKPQMVQYNGIWRIVLKVKWAAWKLENMRFLRRINRDAFAPMDLIGLTLRRLEILRFWLITLINSLHSHLCTQVMQSLGGQFERQLMKTKNIRELRNMHSDYMKALCKHCLLEPELEGIRYALDQIFHLIFVLDMEWNFCPSFLNESHALSVDLASDASSSDSSDREKALEFLALNQIEELERTYIRCHRMLADILKGLVYKDDHKFLIPLEVAINASAPH
ncbi:uncharacterized protein LOC117786312 [Drosophila innubila]|uniref:uncharacterized protein LOC117786312 n=1 Tax=Drosophila innubila TaxID=198719 RepID=UPI00148CAE39|nr:uncharacterized protein LOC117786312 [Drosophila innubila]